jgi:hypothetical protein
MAINRLVGLAVVLGCVRVAGAQPAETPPAPPIAAMSRALTGNNLRIGVSCMAYLATPAEGMQVSVDGTPIAAARVNSVTTASTDADGNVSYGTEDTDVGFDVAPGHHRVTLATPDCVVETHDVDIARLGPTFVTGRMQIADPRLRGTTGAPNGLGFALSYIQFAHPKQVGVNDPAFSPSAYATDAMSVSGGMLTTSFSGRHWLFALDSIFATGTANGVASENGIDPSAGTTGTYRDRAIDFGMAMRVGPRYPVGNFELAGGLGLGGELRGDSSTSVGGNVFAEGPSSVSADWYVPAWAQLTYKPTCSFGFQVMASYDVHPTDMDANGLALSAGIVLQPSAACSEPVGVAVR